MLKLYSFGFLFYPEDAPTGGNVGKQDMIDFMAEGEDDKPEVIDLKDNKEKPDSDKEPDDEKEEDSDKEENNKAKDELSEFEEDDKEPDEEDLELIAPARKAEILKAYPDLFKKFPYLEKAYYREQQFSEIFPTPADAKEAFEKSEALDNFEKNLVAGDSKELFTTLKEIDQNGYHKFIDNFLPNLAETDERAYGNVIGNIIKHAVRTMAGKGKKIGSADLETAAHILYKFTFGDSEWQEPQSLAKNEVKDPNDPNKAAEEKEQKIAAREFERNQTSLGTKINSTLKATIDANIDTKDQMSEYVKKQASRDAFEEVSKILNSDSRLKSILNTLWERAAKSDYADSDLNAIKAAIKARASAVLPAALKKARIEALRGMGKRTTEKLDDDTDTGNKRDSRPETHSRQKPVSRITSGKDIPKGMSSLDFLNSD